MDGTSKAYPLVRRSKHCAKNTGWVWGYSASSGKARSGRSSWRFVPSYPKKNLRSGRGAQTVAQVINRRFTAQTDEPFVVFLIGLRINRPLKVTKWVPTAYAMGPMLRELYRNRSRASSARRLFCTGPVSPWSNTGVPPKTSNATPVPLTRLTSPPGGASTATWVPAGASASGTRCIWSSREDSRPSTTQRHPSVSRKPPV